jgi:DNA polymerase III delta prime subunit
MDISWQKEFAKAWQDRIRHGRMPHAVLLAGPVGVGFENSSVTCS